MGALRRDGLLFALAVLAGMVLALEHADARPKQIESARVFRVVLVTPLLDSLFQFLHLG